MFRGFKGLRDVTSPPATSLFLNLMNLRMTRITACSANLATSGTSGAALELVKPHAPGNTICDCCNNLSFTMPES